MPWTAVCIACTFLTAQALAGEASNASRIALTAEQAQSLRAAIQSEPAAARAFDAVKRLADRSLKEKPQPVQRIISEGRLHSEPEKIRSLAARRDLFKSEALAYAYTATGKREYGEKAREFILAWAHTYQCDGNPINETEFVRLMKAYDIARGLFSADERGEVERWLLGMAEKEKNDIRPESTAARNNHMSHRLKIIGHVAYLLPEPALVRWIAAEYKHHLEQNLNADGTTFDFHQRDALHYHVYDLLPLVELAIAARQNGENFYGYVTSRGATLEKATAFLIPYIEGEKMHREFVHSTVKFDAERSSAGDPSIRVGALWKPQEAKRLFDLAGYFSPRFHEVKFAGGETESFERLLARLGRKPEERAVGTKADEKNRGGSLNRP
ncbi:MAG TPA: alginate lyase family protein [Verrucomicrobiae bacterium]|nr:alginate lyase family protein [Verrucomicrobiae bacterium]